MLYSGKWKLKEVLTFNEDFERVWKSVDELLADESIDDSDKRLYSMMLEFSDDGFIRMMMAIPEDVPQDEIDAAVQSGELEIFENNMMVFEKHQWKEADGKIMYDTGVKGEVFGEPVDPWEEIKEEDGMIKMLTYHLVKADE